jgi:hypothetical protein
MSFPIRIPKCFVDLTVFSVGKVDFSTREESSSVDRDGDRRTDLAKLTGEAVARVYESRMCLAWFRESRLFWKEMVRSSAKAMGFIPAFSRATMSGSIIIINMSGARGHPCLIPERMRINLSVEKGFVRKEVM